MDQGGLLMPSLRLLLGSLLASAILISGCGAFPAPSPQGPQGAPAPGARAPAGRARAGIMPGPQPMTDLRPIQEHTVRYPSPRAGSAYDDPSIGIGVVASAVPGAGAVNAVVLGNVALLGFPSQDAHINHRVAQLIQANFPHIAEVRVTHDPATIGRLQLATQRLMTNQSISDLLPELVNLSGAMPTVQ